VFPLQNYIFCIIDLLLKPLVVNRHLQNISIHISTNFAPTTLPKYHPSGMLSLNSYTPYFIYIQRIHVKSHMSIPLFVFIAAHSRYRISAFCPFYNFLKTIESYRLHPFSAIGCPVQFIFSKCVGGTSIPGPDIGASDVFELPTMAVC
jgi:hypothetical protein